MNYFLQGLTMGLAYVAPIGLQNLFVINTALTHTKKQAFLTALIVIFFDITLALACFFGIGAIMEKYIYIQIAILFIGSLIVIYIGLSLLKAKTDDISYSKVDFSFKKAISSACVVTWFNPQAIIDGTMMLGAFHVILPKFQSISFITGVTAASCCWFLGVTFFISLFNDKFNTKILRWINIICGLVIVFYGVKLFYNFILMIN